MRFLTHAITAFALTTGGVSAAELIAPPQLAAMIDRHIDGRLKSEGVVPAEGIENEGVLRRLTLDLAGRIPTAAERREFLDQVETDQADNRQKVIQRLLDSPDFAYHSRNQLDILLLLRDEHNDEWREYLLEATRENRSWDRIFQEVFIPEDTLSSDVRPVSYVKHQLNDLDALTNDSSVKWLGVNIACAKCHDHPLVDDWTQDHYYGMTSFFKRTFRTKKGFLSERFEGLPKYTDIYGDEKQPGLMFLTGVQVEVPPLGIEGETLKKLQEGIKKSEKDEKAEDPPRPDFRPRAKFVELALADNEKRFFAKNLVNRLWARLFGRGLVHPLDQMHSQNAPSHPALLDDLALDVEASGYDMKRLIHALVSTRAYARVIRVAADSESIRSELFAVAVPRPLSPRQLSLSFRIAGRSPEKMKGLVDGDAWSDQRDQLEKQAEGVAKRLVIPDDGFQVPVTEALWFSNNQSIQNDILNGSGDHLVGYLKEIASDSEAVTAAFCSILNREPAEEELKVIEQYLSEREERREEALKQVVWALLATPEFRFNH
jgi:hypothetical protein